VSGQGLEQGPGIGVPDLTQEVGRVSQAGIVLDQGAVPLQSLEEGGDQGIESLGIEEEGLLGDVRSVHARFRMELMRNSTHLLDTLVYLLDARAERVSGYITGENEAVEALGADVEVDDSGGGGLAVMDDGTFASIDCVDPRGISSMQYDFVGTAGKLYLNNDDGEWRFWRLEDGEHVEADLPGIEGAWTWDDDYEDGFPNAARHVVALLDGDAENRSTGEDATRSLEVIVAFYCSHYTGGWVDVPLARPLRDVTITSW